MSETPAGTSAAPEIVASRPNPWRGAIIALWIVALLVGLLLAITGAVLYGQHLQLPSADTGLVQLFFGTTLTVVGFGAMTGWIVAEMILHTLTAPKEFDAAAPDGRRLISRVDASILQAPPSSSDDRKLA